MERMLKTSSTIFTSASKRIYNNLSLHHSNSLNKTNSCLGSISKIDVACELESKINEKKRTFYRENKQNRVNYPLKRVKNLRKTSLIAFNNNLKNLSQEYVQILTSYLPNQAIFTNLLSQLYEQSIQNFKNNEYEKAKSLIVKILNYSIDFRNFKQFLQTIKQLGEIHTLMNDFKMGLFYYDQCRKCALKTGERQMLIQCLIVEAECCAREGLHDEALRFLKKGLQCCWIYKDLQKQLKVFDEIGKIYYLMGELHKAKIYHNRYIEAIYEPDTSPSKILSNQRMLKYCKTPQFEQSPDPENQEKDIDTILIASLSLPFLTFSQLPPVSMNTSQIRMKFQCDTKYWGNVESIQKLLSDIFSEPFFNIQMQQPDMLEKAPSKHKSLHKRNFYLIDFQLKRHLMEKRLNNSSQSTRPKSLHQQAKKDSDYLLKMRTKRGEKVDKVQQIVGEMRKNHKNSTLILQDKILIRGRNSKSKPNISRIRQILQPFPNGYF